MDIWKWVHNIQRDLREAGNTRLAQLIDEIPPHVCYGRFELAQAALAEAVAGARALDNAWLEVFFRHWIAQGRVAHRAEGESALKDMVELFEFSHRPETIDCPQSVCTTQDVAICYGQVDGPGFAAERIAVCEESLARIDTSWGCFACISSELVDAQVDAGRAPEAVAIAHAHIERMNRDGIAADIRLRYAMAKAQYASGEFDAALATLAWIDAQRSRDDSDDKRRERASLQFLLLAAMGRFEAAWDVLPAAPDQDNVRDNEDIAAGLALVLPALPHLNDVQAGRRTGAILRRFSQIGAHRKALDAAQHHVRQAVARGAGWTARHGLELARPHLAKLRTPMGAIEQFAALEALVAAMPAATPDPDALHSILNGAAPSNPERSLEQLLLAAAQAPHDARLADAVADTMRRCGAGDEARHYLWQFVRANPARFDIGARLLSTLIDEQDRAGILSLVATVQESNPGLAQWCQARLASMTGRWADVGPHVAQLLVHVPDQLGATRLWADAAMQLEQFDQALALRLALLRSTPDDPALQREALIAASAAQQVESVQALAQQLGLDGDSAGGPVRLQFTEEGRPAERSARRTGPATAIVLEVSGQGSTQRVGDVVVFDPVALEEDEDDDDDEAHRPLYRVVLTLSQAGYAPGYIVDGVAPGEAVIARLWAAFDELGWKWALRSKGDYEVYDSETEESYPGLYFVVAAPASVAPAVVDEKLRSLLADSPLSLCWPYLAEAAGVDTDLHWLIEERYNL